MEISAALVPDLGEPGAAAAGMLLQTRLQLDGAAEVVASMMLGGAGRDEMLTARTTIGAV